MASAAIAQEPTSDVVQAEAIAEAIVAREEAASERAFDPIFRTKAKDLLAALPLAELLAQTGDDGLGLNSLGDSQADLVYTPLTPCRIIDTRLAGGPIAAGTTRSFLVTGTDYSAQGGSATSCGVPYGSTTAAVINFVAVDPTGSGNLQLTPYGSALPTASIINYRAAVNLANGLVVAICNPSATTCASDITIKANVSTTGLVADVQGYFQRVATGGVGTALLADAAVTAPKISSGVVVRSLNAQTDAVTLAGINGLSVTEGSGTVTVTSNATATNTPSTIVARDASGNFSAGTITGSLNGNATTATGFTGSLAGEVTGTQVATVVSNAVNTNTASAIVRRDASGGFSAGTVTLAEGRLASGQTMRGNWTAGGFPATAAGQYVWTAFTFPFTLPSAPAAPGANFIALGGASTASCPGTHDNPQAAAGQLCVYATNCTNANVACIGQGSAGSCGTADPYGAFVAWVTAAAGQVYCYGSWAVTAP